MKFVDDVIKKKIPVNRKIAYFCVLWLLVIHTFAQDRKLPVCKIGIVADVQYCDAENEGSRHYRSSLDKLKQAIICFQKEKVDFIVNLGDLIDRKFDSFGPVTQIMHEANIPVCNVLGNHDFKVYSEKKNDVPEVLRLEKTYYSFIRANWRFIFLDGTDISVYANKYGSQGHREAIVMLDSLKAKNASNAYKWNSAIGQKQLKWLHRQLLEAKEGEENVIVFCHFPVFPIGEIENLWNAENVRDLVEQFNSHLAFFNGHTHRSNFNYRKGIYYISFRGMVEKKENSFAVADIFRDSVAIRGFEAEKSYVLKWEDRQ